MVTERRHRILSAGEQYARMAAELPRFRVTRRSVSSVSWEGTIRPMPLSAVYTLRIHFISGAPPSISVLDPRLIRRSDDEPIPHMFTQERLCLYLPAADDWTGEESIARTIVPWASLWLANYEGWHATGDWLGGGVHPTLRSPRRTR